MLLTLLGASSFEFVSDADTGVGTDAQSVDTGSGQAISNADTGASIETQSVAVVGTGNIVPADISGFESGTPTKWSVTAGSATLSHSSAQAWAGSQSLGIAATATTNLAVQLNSGTTTLVPVTAGTSYPASLRVYPTDAKWFIVSLDWFQSNGTTFVSNTIVAQGTAPAGRWTQYANSSITAPTGAAYVGLKVEILSPTNATSYFVDEWLVGTTVGGTPVSNGDAATGTDAQTVTIFVPEKVVDIQLANAAYQSVVPALNGTGDLNAFRTGHNIEGANPFALLGTGGRISGISTLSLSGSGRSTPTLNILDGNLISPQHPTVDVWLKDDPATFPTLASQGAIRMIVSAPSPTGGFSGIIQGRANDTAAWWVRRNVTSGWGLYQSAGAIQTKTSTPGTVRLEIQWDSTQTPSLIVRMYANDGTTQLSGGPAVGSPTSLAINALRFGDFGNTSGGVTWRVGEIEVWKTRNADGVYTNNWTTAQSSSYAGAPRSATYSPPAGFSTPSDTVTVTNGFSSFTNQGYGNFNRVVDVYIPNGTPANAAGFPLVVWAHSGFFVTGDKNDLVTHWRNRLLNAGYAVATVRYLRATLTNSTYQPYGTSDAFSGSVTGYGRYPSFIVDYKLATVRLRDKYAQGGTAPLLNPSSYGIDGTKIIASGYSAGGYIAAAAALTRDLTDDGSGRSMTIAGNTAFRTNELGAAYTGADPTYAGCLVYVAPTNMQFAVDNDWSHDIAGTGVPRWAGAAGALGSNAGLIHAASRAFMGLQVNGANPSGASFANTALSNLIERQQAIDPARLALPLAYVRAEADYLVMPQHQALLQSATSGTAIGYNVYTSPANHDRADEIYRFSDVEAFIQNALTAGPGPQADSGTGTETQSVDQGTVPVSNTDTGTATDAQSVAITATVTDTGTATDAQSVAITATVTDTGTGTDGQSVNQGAVPISSADTAAGTETNALAIAATVTDTGTGTEAQSVAIAATVADTATGTDGQSVNQGAVPISSADTATGTDAQSVAIAATLADTGTAAESFTIVAVLTVTDASTGTEGQLVTVILSVTDTATGTETWVAAPVVFFPDANPRRVRKRERVGTLRARTPGVIKGRE